MAGAIRFVYDDGSVASRYLFKGKEVTNWWFSSLENEYAGVAWWGPNLRSTKVGICWAAIDNPFPDRKINKLIFEAPLEGGIYTVLGVTLSNQKHYVTPKGESFGGPDNWAAANGMAALVEGLAGVKNEGLDFGLPHEGNYMVIDKNLVEFFALFIPSLFPTGRYLGIAHFFQENKNDVERQKPLKDAIQDIQVVELENSNTLSRITLIRGLSTLPFLGIFGFALYKQKQWESYEEKNLVDAVTGASAKTLNIASLKELEETVPVVKIKDTSFSRLILGGNLLSGWAHSRDLIYVSQLVKAYHQKEKIFATLLLAEKCGINTLLTNPILCSLIDEYWKRGIGKIQFISDCAGLNYNDKGASPMPFNEYLDKVKRAIDTGAVACYIQGETADYYMENGKPDAIAKVLDFIRQNGLLTGIGAHRTETIKACVDAGFNPDFWMKTLHHHNYWSGACRSGALVL